MMRWCGCRQPEPERNMDRLDGPQSKQDDNEIVFLEASGDHIVGFSVRLAKRQDIKKCMYQYILTS